MAMTPRNVNIPELVEFYKPIFYLHPDEEFLPIDFQRYIEDARLKHIKTGKDVEIPNYSADQFGRTLFQHPEYNTPDYTLYLPQGMRSPVITNNNPSEYELQQVPLYVNTHMVQSMSNHNNLTLYEVYINYAHMYAYNGASRICQCKKISAGAHYADLEHITVMVTVDERGRHALTKLYTSRHSGGVWLTPDDLLYEKSRPILFSALNSHATYHLPGRHKRFWGLVSDDCLYGKKWDSKRLIMIPKIPMDQVSLGFRWMLFQGKLGNGGVDSFIRKGWLNTLPTEENYGQGCFPKC
jgi:hypothetical protein